jgi:hypothetical protein
MLPPMGYIGFEPQPAALGEFTIATADIDARAQGVASCGRGGPISGILVVSGWGNLVYVDDRTGATCTLTTPDGLVDGMTRGLSIRSINGTANANPSAALTLRCEW